MFKTAVIAAAAVTTATAADLRRAPVGGVIEGEYIVRLNEHTGDGLHDRVQKIADRLGVDMSTKHIYSSLAEHGFAGFSARLSKVGLALLLSNETAVEYIEENQVMHLSDCQEQSNPDWGTTRTNIRGSYSSGPYDYTTGASGSGVDAYIIDTGIYCGNNDFTNKNKGTCTCGVDLIDGSCVDGNGHGTHCAGTVAGEKYGVAKEANLIAVRVLGDSGSGTLDDVVEGIEWAVSAMKSAKRPSVANLSLGSSYSSSVNDATTSAVSAGLNMIVAAGNDNKNACNYSPASAPSAVTVGATDKKDSRASYSNYGECLDIFGPGSDITSAWIGSPSATNTISGTSMASPQVCGVAAKYLSDNPSMSTSQVSSKLVNDATKNVVSNANGGYNSNDSANVSPNLMVYGYCT